MFGLLGVQALGGAVLFAGAWLATLSFRRRSAATRALVWSTAMTAVLALPVLAVVLPRMEIPMLPAVAAAGVGTLDTTPASTPTPPLQGSEAQPLEPDPAPRIETPATLSAETRVELDGGAGSTVDPVQPTSTPRAATPRWHVPPIGAAALLIWACGAVLVLGQLAVGIIRVRGIERRALAVRDSGLKRAFAAAVRQLGLKTHVEMLETGELSVPATWHLWRPCVLVPRAMESWTAERQKAVLLHELAHVRRNDGRLQLLAQAAAALHWFDPFCWVALESLRREREQACDDTVLDAGVLPSDYATHLLEIARSGRQLAPAFVPAISLLPLLRGPALGGRVRAILDPMTGRRSPDRRTTLFVISLTFLLTLPLAAVQPVSAQQAPAAPPAPAVVATPGATRAPALPAAQPHAAELAAPEPPPATRSATSAAPPAAQGQPSIDELVQMRIHGITPEYVQEMAAFLGRALDVDELVTLKIHGTTPEFGRTMAGILGPLDADELVQMRIHGVTPELAQQLEATFGEDLDVDDVVRVRIHGTTPEYVQQMKVLLGDRLTVDDVVQMRIHGLSVDAVRELQELLSYETLDVDTLVRMRIHGVTPELIRKLRDAGYTDLSSDELIKIRIHGMDKVMLRKDGGR